MSRNSNRTETKAEAIRRLNRDFGIPIRKVRLLLSLLRGAIELRDALTKSLTNRLGSKRSVSREIDCALATAALLEQPDWSSSNMDTQGVIGSLRILCEQRRRRIDDAERFHTVVGVAASGRPANWTRELAIVKIAEMWRTVPNLNALVRAHYSSKNGDRRTKFVDFVEKCFEIIKKEEWNKGIESAVFRALSREAENKKNHISVSDFCSNAISGHRTSVVRVDIVYDKYRRWCAVRDIRPASKEFFIGAVPQKVYREGSQWILKGEMINGAVAKSQTKPALVRKSLRHR